MTRSSRWVLTTVVPGLLGLLVVVILAARLVAPPCELGLWGDRDLARAAMWTTDLRSTGAELSYGTGACVPGGAGNALIAFLRTFGEAPVAVQRGLYVLDALAIGLVAWLAGRARGALAAVGVAVAWLGTTTTDATLTQLWNPAYQPLFLALSAVGLHRFGGGGDPRWLGLWGAGVACAAQMHLSAGVWAGAGLVVLLVDARPGTLRALGWAALGLVLVYLPHVADEALHGFPNTRALLDQPHAHALDAPERDWRLEDLLPVLRFVGGHEPAGAAPGWAAAAWPWALVLVVVGLVAEVHRARRGDPEARGGAMVVGATVLALAWLAVDPFIHTQPRYFLAVVPGLALGAGLGLRTLTDAFGGVAGALGALVLAVPATWWLDRTVLAPHPGAAEDELAFERVVELTGWSWAELAGRLILPDLAGEGVTWRAMGPVDDLLRRHGATFEGSAPPPCGALFIDAPREAASRGLADAVAVGPSGFVVLDWLPLMDRRGLLLYDPGTPLCPTSLVQRYVDRPWEAVVRAASRDLPVGAVRTVEGPDGEGVLVVSAPGELALPRLVAVLRLDAAPTGPVAVLESAQLRGEALNLGWFESALVDRPRLLFTDLAGGGVVEVPLVDGLLGFRAAATPVRASLTGVGPGRWRVELLWRRVVVPLGADTPWPMSAHDGVDERFTLFEALTLPR